MTKIVRVMQANVVVTLLLTLFFVEVWSLFAVSPVVPKADEGVSAEVPLKISEIDGPRIDAEAASIEADEDTIGAAPAPLTLPGEVWVFLLLVYVALLLFNFSSTFEKVTSPQWFWEVLYTLLALLAWLFLDAAALYTWFPLMVIKLALLIFALYVYLLEKRGMPHREEPKTEPLF